MLGRGWKGKTGGVLLALSGVGMIVEAINPGAGHALGAIVNGAAAVAAGLGIYGIRDAQGR